jgi:hypothetical protein
MTTLREAALQALEALQTVFNGRNPIGEAPRGVSLLYH